MINATELQGVPINYSESLGYNDYFQFMRFNSTLGNLEDPTKELTDSDLNTFCQYFLDDCLYL